MILVSEAGHARSLQGPETAAQSIGQRVGHARAIRQNQQGGRDQAPRPGLPPHVASRHGLSDGEDMGADALGGRRRRLQARSRRSVRASNSRVTRLAPPSRIRVVNSARREASSLMVPVR